MTENEIIAEFMGLEFKKEIEGIKYYSVPPGHVASYNASMGQFYYHKSWDWLMPVVEKIESEHDASYLCRIVSRRCIIYDSNIADQAAVYQGSGEGIVSGFVNQDSKLIACYKAVVQFIKWYNQQKP